MRKQYVLELPAGELRWIYARCGGRLAHKHYTLKSGLAFGVCDSDGCWRWADTERECRYSPHRSDQYWDAGEHTIVLPCYYELRGRNLDLTLYREFRRLTLPAGFVWGQDANGLRLVHQATGDDFHPVFSNLVVLCLLAQYPIRQLMTQFDNNRETRRIQRIENEKNARAIATAGKRGVRVCFDDARAAGNCAEGITAFASRYGLSIDRYYSPSFLLGHANGDEQRVRLSIGAAVARHDRLASLGAEIFYPAA
jgi:hypothetical protein